MKEQIFINQAIYTKELVKKFGMENSTPMNLPIKLDKNENGILVDEKRYKGMIGSLLHLTANSYIMSNVCLYARYQFDHKKSHLCVVKGIFRYFLGIKNFGLWYPKDNNFDLVGYSNANFACCKLDRKGTNKTCQFLGDSFIKA